MGAMGTEGDRPTSDGPRLEAIIAELRSAYRQLVPYIRDQLGSAYYAEPPEPIIAVEPRGRHRRPAWYRPAAWRVPSQVALAALAGRSAPRDADRDEIGLATELLGEPVLALCYLVAEATIHVAACDRWSGRRTVPPTLPSDLGPRGATRRWLLTHVGLTVDWAPTGGWVPTGAQPELRAALDALTIDYTAFDLARLARGQKGKMKKWTCACTGASLRAAAIIDGVCRRCGQQYQYSDQDRYDPDIVARLRAAGVPIAP